MWMQNGMEMQRLSCSERVGEESEVFVAGMPSSAIGEPVEDQLQQRPHKGRLRQVVMVVGGR